jgi:hypothetical protein
MLTAQPSTYDIFALIELYITKVQSGEYSSVPHGQEASTYINDPHLCETTLR